MMLLNDKQMIVGLLVEKSKENKGGVRIKFLGLPGDCGPELNLDKSLALALHRFHGQHLETGEKQEL